MGQSNGPESESFLERAGAALKGVLNTRLTRERLVKGTAAGAAVGGALASPLGRAVSAFADGGNPAPELGGGEELYKPGELRAIEGGVEYVWPDGKSIVLTVPQLNINFDKVYEVQDQPLVDIQTGKPRDPLPLHQELRNYLDFAGADRLVVNNDPSLTDRLANRQTVGTISVNRANARQNPEAVFVFYDTMMKPTDDIEHPNDIRLSLYFNPECPVTSSTVVNINGTDMPLVYYDFYGGLGASELSQLTEVFHDAAPNTRFVPFAAEGDNPIRRLNSNLRKLQPFEIAPSVIV